MIACQEGHVQIVDFLLQHGANTEIKSYWVWLNFSIYIHVATTSELGGLITPCRVYTNITDSMLSLACMKPHSIVYVTITSG